MKGAAERGHFDFILATRPFGVEIITDTVVKRFPKCAPRIPGDPRICFCNSYFEIGLYVLTIGLIYLNINQLDALNFIMSISFLYMFRAYVLIVRRSELYYTVSGIITPIGGHPVHRLREDSLVLETCRGMK